MKMLLNSLKKNLRSYRFAWNGISHSTKHENNFRYQIIAGLVVIVAGLYLKLNIRSWLIIILLIGLVLMAELFNTAIERLADIVHPEEHPEIGKVKDVAAGAVLVISVTAFIIGVIIFGPALTSFFE